MSFTASDIPSRVDLLLNGEGYLFAETEEAKAVYGITPTFVTRQNVQGDFGDNFQDFWLTYSQNDWSLGDGQKFFKTDEEARRRYYTGTGVDIQVPGQVTIGRRIRTATIAGADRAVAAWQSPTNGGSDVIKFATATKLFTLDSAAAMTDHGAHGLGAQPDCGTSDGRVDFFSTADSGTVGVRKWDGVVFSTFSATPAQSLCYVNNTLFGFDRGVLVRYDSAGAATTIHTFLAADAVTKINLFGNLYPYGGKVLILTRQTSNDINPRGHELFLYDGVGVTKIADLGKGLEVGQETEDAPRVTIANGIIFIGVNLTELNSGGTSVARAGVWYYANGTTGLLWTEERSSTLDASSGVRVASFNGGLIFLNEADGRIFFYDLTRGGISQITSASLAPVGSGSPLAVGKNWLASFTSTTTVDLLFGTPSAVGTYYAASGTLTSSQIDFGSSLDKLFRGIKVDFETQTGATVDIAYQVNGTGGFTTLQTGAVSGTEYLLAGVSGRTIQVSITLNGNGENNGPIVKRVSVRAAPKQFSFRKQTHVLALGGRDGEAHCQLRDGSFHPNDGLTQATNLRAVANAGTPVTIVDEFGSFTGIIENEGFQLRRFRPNEFVAVVPVREV